MLEGIAVRFPPESSPQRTRAACQRWWVTRCPLNIRYWRRVLEEENFPPVFQTWLLRTIEEGVNLGYQGPPRDHLPRYRKRPPEEITQLQTQYTNECDLGRIICTGSSRPWGGLFPCFVSPTYTIPKKRKIGQPQKWRLIHNFSGHDSGKWGSPTRISLCITHRLVPRVTGYFVRHREAALFGVAISRRTTDIL